MGTFWKELLAVWPDFDSDLRRGLAHFRADPHQVFQPGRQAATIDEPDVLARNVAAGHIGHREVDWLRGGFATWLSNRGGLHLDRCLHLPTSHKKMARAERDRYLREAWDLLAEVQPWRKSVALAAEIQKFETRIWPAWKSSHTPPQGASELRRLLFMAMRSGASMPSTVQQVHNICNPAD